MYFFEPQPEGQIKLKKIGLKCWFFKKYNATALKLRAPLQLPLKFSPREWQCWAADASRSGGVAE